jgi:catechol 2,3-dioxygenase-like lactoylglutathione lyase family enzyme
MIENFAMRLHHVAYATWDMPKTVEFWTKVMNLKLKAHVAEEFVPTSGMYQPFLHLFFGMADGSDLAFFELRDLPKTEQEVGISRSFKHIAFEVESAAELEDYCQRLVAHNVPFYGPEEDTFNRYIYFFDPNEIKVQIALPLATQPNLNHAQILEEWLKRPQSALCSPQTFRKIDW